MDTHIAYFVNYFHSFITIFAYFAWYFLPIEYLHHYILFLALIIIHWFILDGYCILTVIEYKMLNKKLNAGYNNAPFLKQLLLKFGCNIDESFIASLCNISMFMLIFITIIRINKYKKN